MNSRLIEGVLKQAEPDTTFEDNVKLACDHLLNHEQSKIAMVLGIAVEELQKEAAAKGYEVGPGQALEIIKEAGPRWEAFKEAITRTRHIPGMSYGAGDAVTGSIPTLGMKAKAYASALNKTVQATKETTKNLPDGAQAAKGLLGSKAARIGAGAVLGGGAGLLADSDDVRGGLIGGGLGAGLGALYKP